MNTFFLSLISSGDRRESLKNNLLPNGKKEGRMNDLDHVSFSKNDKVTLKISGGELRRNKLLVRIIFSGGTRGGFQGLHIVSPEEDEVFIFNEIATLENLATKLSLKIDHATRGRNFVIRCFTF
jgi:hypothetical protein